MEKHERGTMIEGISDGVIYGFIGILSVLTFVFYWASKHARQQHEIHPQSRETVQGTREILHEQQHAAPTRPSVRHPRDNLDTAIQCPICIGGVEYGVETNCGHLFCGMCMLTYWNHGNWMGSMRCPVCRQQVTLLLFNFTAEERQQAASETKQTVERDVNRYNRRFSNEPLPWLDYIRELPTILSHCLRDFFTVSGLLWVFRIRIIVCVFAALLYFISPLDIIPEAAFGLLGLVDDFFIVLLLAIYVSILYRRYLATRY